jgi:hypothetical protein
MAKFTPKFSRQIKSAQDLTQHIQEVTDDLAKVITEGISFDGGNSRLFTTLATSGQPFSLPTPSIPKFKIKGAVPIFVQDGGVITSTSYQQTSDSMLLTIVFSAQSSYTVTCLVIYD